MKKDVVLLIALIGLNIALDLIGKKLDKNNLQEKCTEQLIRDMCDKDKRYKRGSGYCWQVTMPVPSDKKNMDNLKKIISSLKCDQSDYVTVDFEKGIYSETYGTATYIQTIRRKEAYQIELHFEDGNGKMFHFVRFVPDRKAAVKIFEQLLVQGSIPEMDTWFEFSRYITADEK